MEKYYYTYIYLDPRKPGRYNYPNVDITFLYEPFYVGKGSRFRIKAHMAPCQIQNPKTQKARIIRKLIEENNPPHILILYKGNETDSLSLECLLIKNIGRDDLKIGPLCNLTNRGESNGGYVWSEEQKLKAAERMRVRICKPETRLKLRLVNLGRKKSPESVEKSASKNRGSKRSPEQRLALSLARRNRKMSEFQKSQISKALTKYCAKNPRPRAENHPTMKKYVLINPKQEYIKCYGCLHRTTKQLKIGDTRTLRNTLETGKPVGKGRSKGWRLILDTEDKFKDLSNYSS